MKKKRIPVIVITLALVGALFLFGKLIKPGIHASSPDQLLSTNIDPDSLIEGRHYDLIKVDSFLALIDKINSPTALVSISKGDSLIILRLPSISEPVFRRIFLNKRTPQDFRRLKNCQMSPIDHSNKYGYAIKIEEINGTSYSAIPYDLISGILVELENRR